MLRQMLWRQRSGDFPVNIKPEHLDFFLFIIIIFSMNWIHTILKGCMSVCDRSPCCCSSSSSSFRAARQSESSLVAPWTHVTHINTLAEGKFLNMWQLMWPDSTSCLRSCHCLLLLDLSEKKKTKKKTTASFQFNCCCFFYYNNNYYYLSFIFHSVRQPYSETSCSCVLVDGFTVLDSWTIKAKKWKWKRKWKGWPEPLTALYLNCFFVLFFKCKETWNIIIPAKHRRWICCYIVYICRLSVFFPLSLIFFFFWSALHPVEELVAPDHFQKIYINK